MVLQSDRATPLQGIDPEPIRPIVVEFRKRGPRPSRKLTLFMSRWSYLIARLVILGLVLLGVWVGADPLTRIMIVNRIEDVTGTDVEIGQLRCSFSNHRLLFKDLAIARRNDPLSNLAQTDMLYFEFDPEALLHRQVVIENAQTSRLMFGTPRMTPIKTNRTPSTSPTAYQSLRPTAVAMEAIGQAWLDGLAPLPTVASDDVPSQFSSTAKQISTKWNLRLDEIEKRVATIQAETKSAGDEINAFDGNPLRWKPNRHVLTGIETQSAEVLSELSEYQAQLRNDLRLLNQAAVKDADSLQAIEANPSFQPAAMSHLLLAKLHAEYADEAIDLIRWIKHAVPEIENDFQPTPTRGMNVDFSESKKRPGFIIRSMQLNGEGRFLDDHFNFAGTAFNVSNEPQHLKEPTRIELRAQGERHVLINYTIDRRDGNKIDQFDFGCPEIPLKGRTLGEPESLLVTMGPDAKIQANLHLSLVDGKLDGSLVFQHSEVALHVDQLNELAGGENTVLKMNQGLGLVRNFKSEIKLSGNLEEPKFDAKSDLGKKFANAVNSVLMENRDNAIAKRKALLKKAMQVQLDNIDATIEKRLRALAAKLQNNSDRVSQLQKVQPSNSRISNQWR